MVILGIDPGYATVGYGVLEYLQGRFRVMDYGAVTSPAGMDFPSRLEIIFQGIGELCDQFRPDCMAVEELFFNTNITTGIQVGHARGVILLAGKLKGVQCFEYTPLQVKQSSCWLRPGGKASGYGNDQAASGASENTQAR